VRTSLSRRSSSEGVPVGHTPGLIGKGGGSMEASGVDACAGRVLLGLTMGVPQQQPPKGLGPLHSSRVKFPLNSPPGHLRSIHVHPAHTMVATVSHVSSF
jgi:hypothetical protein